MRSVPIASLADESGLELKTVHRLLLSHSEQGIAKLSKGDSAMASDEENAAALVIRNRKYLNVQLQG